MGSRIQQIPTFGKVKISMPIPSGYDKSNLVVYRVDDDGTITEYTVTVSGEYPTFETDHFSTYVIAEKMTGEKDETPKTGVVDELKFVMSIIVISAVGVIALKKRK